MGDHYPLRETSMKVLRKAQAYVATFLFWELLRGEYGGSMYAIRLGGSSTSCDMNERLYPNKGLNLITLTAGAISGPSVALGCWRRLA